jgi:hypothetical protein
MYKLFWGQVDLGKQLAWAVLQENCTRGLLEGEG